MPGLLTARPALVIAVLALGVGAGCQTRPSPPAASSAPKRTFQGQLHYTAPARSTVGETVVAVFPGGSFDLEFVSGPGFPLLKLHHDGRAAVAEGIFARGRWRGSAAGAPEPLKSWLVLREVFAQAAVGGSGTVKLVSPGPGVWSADAEYSRQRLRNLRVVFPRTGERFSFRFAG